MISYEQAKRLKELLNQGGEYRDQAEELLVPLMEHALSVLAPLGTLQEPYMAVRKNHPNDRHPDILGVWCRPCAEAFRRAQVTGWGIYEVAPAKRANPPPRCPRCFSHLRVEISRYEYRRLHYDDTDLSRVPIGTILQAGRMAGHYTHDQPGWLRLVREWLEAQNSEEE